MNSPDAPAPEAPDATVRNLLIVIGLVAVIAAAGVLLFSFGIEFMLQKWETPEYNHGYMIPLVGFYLLWLRARE
ncbi:MAG: hypothetical protein OEW88_02945, partial [Gammaproteobacteria bacterium]|nr:hypothetical protein [Gammaproteobacteria bacterium]